MKWAVDGCIMYHREGLEPPAVVQRSTEEYKSEMDLLATFMEAADALKAVCVSGRDPASGSWENVTEELFRASHSSTF